MKDSDYERLKLRSLIAPESEQWPETNLSHFQNLRKVVGEARERTRKAYMAMDEIDRDTNLSPEGKAASRRKIAESAITGLQKAEVLENCRAAVQRQMQTWASKVDQAIKRPTPEDAATAKMYAQIRDRIANLKEGGLAHRLSFIDKHYDDVIDAVLAAPPFLSGLSDAEYNVVRTKFEQRVLGPEVAEARAAAEKAMQEAERGWQRAIKAIAERGNLDKRTLAAA